MSRGVKVWHLALATVLTAANPVTTRWAHGQTPAQIEQQPHKLTLSDVRQFADLLIKQIQNGENWSAQSSKYVDLYYVSGSAASADEANNIAQLFDRCVEADCKTLALDLPTTKIPVYLFPTASDVDKAIGVPEKIVGGMSFGSWAVIIHPVGGSEDELGANGAHELGQALVHDQVGLYGSPLFSEGIAFYLQAQFRHSDWLNHPSPLQPIPLSQLVIQAKQETDLLEGARFFAYLVGRDHGDPTHIKAVLAGLNKERIDEIREVGTGSWPARVDRTFKGVYGKDLAGLETEWRRDLK